MRIYSEKRRFYASFYRIFLPSLASFFEEAIDQSDPSAMIEDEYK